MRYNKTLLLYFTWRKRTFVPKYENYILIMQWFEYMSKYIFLYLYGKLITLMKINFLFPNDEE